MLFEFVLLALFTSSYIEQASHFFCTNHGSLDSLQHPLPDPLTLLLTLRTHHIAQKLYSLSRTNSLIKASTGCASAENHPRFRPQSENILVTYPLVAWEKHQNRGELAHVNPSSGGAFKTIAFGIHSTRNPHRGV